MKWKYMKTYSGLIRDEVLLQINNNREFDSDVVGEVEIIYICNRLRLNVQPFIRAKTQH